MVYGANIGLLPELHSWIAFIGSAFGVKSPFENVNNFLLEQILARQSGKSIGTNGDFLDKLLTLETHGKIERQDTFTTLGANVAAGSDTTAIGLSAVIYLLIKNPSCLGKLQDEIDEFAKDGRISNPVTFKEAQEMPYLQAVIKEALRIHPATAELLARVVPDGGVELDGYFFPSGVGNYTLAKKIS
jgi:cytochrome P450